MRLATRNARLFLLSVAITTLVSACKKESSDSPARTDARPPTAAPTPQIGGYVVIPSNEPPLLNPVLQTAFDRATPLIFEGLVGLDGSLNPKPLLAESWDQSSDGKEVVFHLRKGVRWHDGQPFTASDVLFTVERIRKDNIPSVWRGYLSSVASIEAPDDYTIKVDYVEPYGPALASWTFGIIPEHVYKDQKLTEAAANRSPVGTGPFRFVRWTPRKHILLEANDQHWRQRPRLNKVELVFDVGAGEGLAALRAGKLDLAEIDRPEQWSGEILTPEFRSQYETATLDESSMVVVAYNCQRKLFTDRRVRLAMTHALDRARFIEDVLMGAGRRISGPFYSTMWGSDPDIAPWPFDVEKAALLLDAAGVRRIGKKRFSFELIALQSHKGPIFDSLMAIWRNSLQALGVDVRVTFLSPSDFVGRMILHDFDAAYFKWWPDIADPDPFVLLHGSQIGEGANYAGYANADADRLLEKARSTTDRWARREHYRDLHRIIHDDQPYTFIYSPITHYAWGRRVHGVNPIDIGSLARSPGISMWWVDP